MIIESIYIIGRLKLLDCGWEHYIGQPVVQYKNKTDVRCVSSVQAAPSHVINPTFLPPPLSRVFKTS